MRPSPATDYAMTLLQSVMNNGAVGYDIANEVLHNHHACSLHTLNRMGLIVNDDNIIKTPERYNADYERAKRIRELKERRKAAKAELESVEAELQALRKRRV